MKLTDIQKPGFCADIWEERGYKLPQFDMDEVRHRTAKEPTWLHFGAGNLFRAFPAARLQDLLDVGLYDRGVIAATGGNPESIEKTLRAHDNKSLLVLLKADGTVEKRVVASIAESLKTDCAYSADWARLEEIFRSPSLQMVSYTITEKGYVVPAEDLRQGLEPRSLMGKTARLLLERWRAGACPLTLQSMDNCAHNGDRLREAVLAYVRAWTAEGLTEQGFLDYVADRHRIAFPWSMIDKITPRPDEKVSRMLAAEGFEDHGAIGGENHPASAPFVNAEEAELLVIEDDYPNGRPPLEKAGVLFTDRETVDKVEKMKVCTCLNPLHTAMSIFGCLLGYTRIFEEMGDEDIRSFITRIAYEEGMPVVVDPGILRPEEFLETVLEKRLANPFVPDAPQRIAMDTSQKLPIRFGETIKAYVSRGMPPEKLQLIPLVFAGYARYLRGVDDTGVSFAPSSDPLLEELQALVAPLQVREGAQDMSCLCALFSRGDIFGVDLYAVGLGQRAESLAAELFAGHGAVRRTLHKYVVMC